MILNPGAAYITYRIANILQADVKCQSAKNHARREETKKATVSATMRVPHNYSTQSLNSMEAAKEKLRQLLSEVSSHLY